MISIIPYFAGLIMLLFGVGFYFAIREHRDNWLPEFGCMSITHSMIYNIKKNHESDSIMVFIIWGLDTWKMSQTSDAFNKIFSGVWEFVWERFCSFNFSETTSSMVVVICFQNPDGVMGNSIGVSFIHLHFPDHNRNSNFAIGKVEY